MATVSITLTAINPTTGAATFTMKRGAEATITQTVDGLPVSGVAADFVAAAKQYAIGYYTGSDAKVSPVVSAAVTALVGQSTNVTV